MLHSVVAKEQGGGGGAGADSGDAGGGVKTLNYAPGPLAGTDMTAEIKASTGDDGGVGRNV